MANALYAIEIHLIDDSWIVFKAGREIASHRQQREALEHVERLLGIAGHVEEAAHVFRRRAGERDPSDDGPG